MLTVPTRWSATRNTRTPTRWNARPSCSPSLPTPLTARRSPSWRGTTTAWIAQYRRVGAADQRVRRAHEIPRGQGRHPVGIAQPRLRLRRCRGCRHAHASSWPTATRAKAEVLARKLGDELWANRERYATKYLSIPEAMERATLAQPGPAGAGLIAPIIPARDGALIDSTFVLKALVDKAHPSGAVRRDVVSDGLPDRRGGGRGRADAHAAGRQIGRGQWRALSISMSL